MTTPPDDTTVALRAGGTAASRMAPTIAAASQSTGVSFGYLMAQAGNESAFESHAKSHLSSAAGLFQFTQGTWLQLVKTHGTVHGLGDLVDHIQKTTRGDYVVRDPRLRREILELRRDPQIAAMMAGEYANDNKKMLEKSLGRRVDSTDLYMAHFLGPAGAARILKANAVEPSQSAAALLPEAAGKNTAVFFDTQHTPRSVAAVYNRIRQTIELPMQQYAPRDPAGHEPVTRTATTALETRPPTARPGAEAAAAPPAPWPFETGQWPPAPPPTTLGGQIAFTDAAHSADQVSSAMPPAQGRIAAISRSESPVEHLLRTLFG